MSCRCGRSGARPGKDAATRAGFSPTRRSLQRFAGTTAEPVLVQPGVDGILAERGSLLLASLPAKGLDRTRTELAERTTLPLLLVRGGLRPSGLAPEQTLTRFSWSLAQG